MDTNWDESVVLDMAHLTEYTGDDTAVRAKAIAVFQQNAPAYLEALKQADSENWKERAHKLKGAARGLGAWRVAKQGERAEFLENPMTNVEARSACLDELEQRLSELLIHLDTL